jgi:hypothetical protein
VTVRKDQVADIDHPGNVLAIAGAPFVVPGLLWLASPSFRCEGGGSHAFCTSLPFAAVLGGAGVATTIWGMVVYNKSTRAAGASTPPLTGAPVVWRDQGTRFLGGAMSFNY